MNGFLAGSLVQYLVNPLFKLNIANHNYRLSDSKGLSVLYQKAIRERQSMGEFLFRTPFSIVIRGGILGMIQQGFFSSFVNFLESPF